MTDETWIYPAPAWENGDRVIVDSESHAWHDEIGTVVGPDDRDDNTWLVLLDGGETVSVYSFELDGIR